MKKKEILKQIAEQLTGMNWDILTTAEVDIALILVAEGILKPEENSRNKMVELVDE